MKHANLNDFLTHTKNEYSDQKAVTVIMGNEASDLDSMASSISYAYLLNEVASDDSRQFVPVMNIPRNDFKLRTEAVYLFDAAGVDLDQVLFMDDIDVTKLQANQDTKVIMMDHNRLSKAWSAFEKQVDGILDHHANEEMYDYCQNKTIEPVGSCITLVAEQYFNQQPQMVDEKVATLMLGTILLDTVNMDPKAERVTPKDEKYARQLLEVVSLSQQELFDKVQAEKFNCSNLDTPDLLRKDYKEWQLGDVKCGIGSVLLSCEEWFKKDQDIAGQCQAYAKQQNLDVLFVMVAYTNPGFQRELGLFSANKDLYDRTLNYLQSEDLGLQLKDIPLQGQKEHPDLNLSFFSQGHLGYSRKKLQPKLNDFYTK